MNDMGNMSRKKRIILISIIIVLVLSLVVAGTYALWTWNSNVNKNVVFNTSKGMQYYIYYDAGESKFVGDFQASDTYTGGIHTTITMGKSSEIANIGLYATINMTIKAIGSNLANSSALKWVITKGNSTNPGTVLNSGSFIGHSLGDNIVLASSIEITTTNTEYTIWIWLDSSMNPGEEISGETIDASVWTQINQGSSSDEPEVEPNAPVLDDGMIPIVFDTSNGTVIKTVSSTDSSWYNYNNKEWANAVLVKESGTQTRTYYKANPGVAIDESDILAYYVWIPRYKYKIWSVDNDNKNGNEQTIDIVFESTSSISTGTEVGEYITHPAFWWDNDSDGVRDSGEELSGIWVGKFETTGTADSPTILPNVNSLRSQNVSTQFATAQKLGGTTYGVSSGSDSHMMKNNEWGAVAYLSHSKYGVNREVYINNSSSYYTGRSGGNVGGSTSINEIYTDQTSTTQYNNYGYYTWDGYLLNYNTNTKSSTRDLTKVASTTGNITGIYDMSGGTVEYVMGNYNDTISGSGFTSMPDGKYYDKYTTTSALTACNGGVCCGHALSETSYWYGDSASFVSADFPWFLRGGNHNFGSVAGAFGSGRIDGSAGIGFGFRSVLSPVGA
jgi:hypothetical protein